MIRQTILIYLPYYYLCLLGFANGWLLLCPRRHAHYKHQGSVFSSKEASTSCSRKRRGGTQQSRHRTAFQIRGSSSDDDKGHTNNAARDVYFVSWEGCLVDTVHWRTQAALKVCCQVWPDLEVLISSSSCNDDDDDNFNNDEESSSSSQQQQQQEEQSWLYNKVRDLHHVLVLDPAYSPTVEYALLIRMLLEEQELDQGRSNGSRGKYGSKYHPPADSEAFNDDEFEPTFNPRRQRPLTVGEIAANWLDSLREAVLIRYYQEEKQNPLDMLQQAVDSQNLAWTSSSIGAAEAAASSSMSIQEEDLDVLRTAQQSRDSTVMVVLTVPHASDLPVVEATLQASPSSSSSSSIDVCVYDNVKEALAASAAQSDNNDKYKNTRLPVMYRTKDLVQESLELLPEGSSLYVLESSWPVLQKHVHVFGDCIPRAHDGGHSDYAQPCRCRVPSRYLQLALWRNTHPNDQAAALMNPWTTTSSSRRRGNDSSSWPRALLQQQQQQQQQQQAVVAAGALSQQ